MHNPLYTILLFILSFSPTASTLTLSPQNSTSPLLLPGVYCLPWSPFYSHRLEHADCQLAIAQFPSTSDIGRFHRGAPDDPFQLPRERTVGTCTVRVELEGSKSDPLSWEEIVVQATRVAFWCRYPSLNGKSPWNKGGGVRVGPNERIIAILESSGGGW